MFFYDPVMGHLLLGIGLNGGCQGLVRWMSDLQSEADEGDGV